MKYDIYPCDIDTFGVCPYGEGANCATCKGWQEDEARSEEED